MRLERFMLLVLLCVVSASPSHAHPEDEFPQVTLEVEIDDERVRLLSEVPAEYVSRELFPGESPIDLDRIEPVDLAKRVQPILAELCPLSIDGAVVPPTVVQAEMLMTDSRLPVRSFSERQARDRGYLTLVAEYETKGKPRRVDLTWTLLANDYGVRGEEIYEDEELFLIAVTRAYGKYEVSLITPVEPGMTWHSDEAFVLPADLLVPTRVQQNFLHIPALSVGVWMLGLVVGIVFLRRSWAASGVIVASGVLLGLLVMPIGQIKLEHTPTYEDLEEDQALAIFESLHRNIYRAFDYTDEGAVYDALAQSVDGPMLETIYNDVYQSLIMREENGAVSKVVRVDMQSKELVDYFDSAAATPPDEKPGTFVVQANWQVDGVVKHFGHSHTRTNAFEAVYTVAPRGEGWRIVEAQILQQERIDDGTQSE